MNSAGTILVVGASDQRRGRIVALLAASGYSVTECAEPADALVHVAEEATPLAILDFAPQDAAMLAVCHRMKAERPGIFLFQISPDTEDAAETSDDTPIDVFLVDPIQPREMSALVRSLLRLHKVEADLRDSEERLKLAQDSADIAVLDWSIPGNTFVRSESFSDLFDLHPGLPDTPLAADQILARVHGDDLEALIAEFAETSKSGGRFDTEFRIVRRDGAIRWISSRGRFFNSANGTPERMLSLNFDVTERKEAERANAELAAIVASSVDGIVGMDLAGNVTSWNAGAEHLFGLAAAAVLGRPLADAVPSLGGDPGDTLPARLAVSGAHGFELRHVGADGPIDLGVTGAPVLAASGRVIGASLILRDVSAQKEREDHIRFLMRELTHRSKNLLAVIQAMARQSLTKGVTPEEFVRRFSERLAGLAGSHDLLSSVDWKGASLMDLVRSQLNHYQDLFGSRIRIDDADLFIRPEAAQNIGIALHELSTNAAKYGALSNDDGIVTISWVVGTGSERILTLRWQESGGPAVVQPTRQGFGHVVMERIAGRALGGKSGICFRPEGVVWTMEVPAAAALVI